MKAEELKIEDVLVRTKTFVIPPYQRPYSWDEDNACQLVEDICTSMNQEDNEYFIGSLICIQDPKNDYRFEIVDGQQRLTTLTLICAKLCDLINESEIKADLQERILHKDPYSDMPEEPRLKVRQKEYELFTNHIVMRKNSGLPAKPTHTESLFINNFRVIGKYLEKLDKQNLIELTRYILRNVFIVFVRTEDFSSSYRLFNVLNNRGTPLTYGDLIKNKLFEKAESHHIASEQVEQKWAEFEQIIGIENIDCFLNTNTMASKKDKDRAPPKSLAAYTHRLEKEYNNNVLPFLSDLLTSARNYQDLKDAKFEGDARKIIRSLSRLQDEWLPVVLAFMNRSHREKCFSDQDFCTFLEAFEKAFYQGGIRKLNKGERQKLYFEVLPRINLGHTLASIVEGINMHVDNDDLAFHLRSDMYNPSKKKARKVVSAILLRLEEEMQDDSVQKTYDSISIEHILPNNMKDPYWQQRFSEEAHTQWVQKLGNLTLLSCKKNSSAAHYSFPRKLESYARLNKNVSFDLTKEICEASEWTPEQIRHRQDRLVHRCLELWSVEVAT